MKVINFFKNLIGDYDVQYLKIQEITYDGEVSDRVKVSLIRNYVTAGGTS